MGKLDGRFPFLRLPGARPRAEPGGPAGRNLCLLLHGRGDYAHEVIGVSRNRQALRDLAGMGRGAAPRQHCIATLICREGKPYERRTVAVEVAGRTAGYCPSALATRYREWLEEWRFTAATVRCRAVIVAQGQTAHDEMLPASLRLDIEMPFKATSL